MPLDTSTFPDEVQAAFFIFDMLSDRWDGMSGAYLGKDWSSASFLFDLYEFEDVETVVFFTKMYETLIVKERAEKAEQKRKQEERKAKNSAGGGQSYTHNIKG